jgi:hypothetical protein
VNRWRAQSPIALGLSAGFLLLLFVALLAADILDPTHGAEAAADDTHVSVATPTPAPPPAAALHGRWVSQSPIRVIGLTESATFTLVFRNTGSTDWVRGSASEARLGIAGDDRGFFDLGQTVAWLAPDRPTAQGEEVVQPGETATFTFQVRGMATGFYRLNLRLVVDGVTWLEDEGVFVEVVVR